MFLCCGKSQWERVSLRVRRGRDCFIYNSVPENRGCNRMQALALNRRGIAHSLGLEKRSQWGGGGC